MSEIAAPTVVPSVVEKRNVVVPIATIAILAVGWIINAVAFFGFPENAPVEWLLSIGISIDLLFAAIAIAIVIAVRRSRPVPPLKPGIGGFALTAIILSGVALLVTLALGGIQAIARIGGGEPLRYMYDVQGIFVAGVPWAAGAVFAALSYRKDARGNVLAFVALGITVLLLVPTLISGVVYGLGLSD